MTTVDDSRLETWRKSQADSEHRHGRDLKRPGDDGTYDGMDPWQTSVEARLGQLHTDVTGVRDRIDSNFKWLLGVLGVSFVSLGGMIITSYLLLADKIDALTR